MDFTAKLIMELPETGGTSQRGTQWRKKSWVLETFGQYPRKVKVDAMNASIDRIHMEPGKTYNVSVDAESREYNDRWYTDLRVYAATEVPEPSAGISQTSSAPADPFSSPASPSDPFAGTASPFTTDNNEDGDDLPF